MSGYFIERAPESLFAADDCLQIKNGHTPIGGGEGWLRLVSGIHQPDYTAVDTDSSTAVKETRTDFEVVQINVISCVPSFEDIRVNRASKTFGEVRLRFTGRLIDENQQFVSGYIFPSGSRRGSLYPGDFKQ